MNGRNIAILGGITFLGIIFLFFLGSSSGRSVNNGNNQSNTPPKSANNVSIVDGKQIVEIKAKGGYSPVKSTAKAGIPTIIRVQTKSTFDCSSLVRIPSMQISEILSANGTKDIDIGTPEAGILRGTCGMGMYPFEINFQS